MTSKEIGINILDDIRGKTIAIVYIFEGDTAPGYAHYDVWKSDVIACWLNAIQELRCMPFILDARTFVNKAMNNSLPTIDFVVNLNNGTTELSTLGLVPSVCSFLSIPCIPCSAASIIIGENKHLSNLLAKALQINFPKYLDAEEENGISKPYSLGSSIGITRGKSEAPLDTTIYQEFIPGVDMTTPVMYNPMTNRLEVLPSVMYIPDTGDPDWYFGEKEKATHSGYSRCIVSVNQDVRNDFLRLAKAISTNTFCRIDCRVKCNSAQEIDMLIKSTIVPEQVYFIEINPMPTIKNNNNFNNSINGIVEHDSFYQMKKYYSSAVENESFTGFVLACSMLAYTKAKH